MLRLRLQRLQDTYKNTSNSKVNSNANHIKDDEKNKNDEDNNDINESMIRSMN